MKEWIVKLMELAEMAKLTTLMKNKQTKNTIFVSICKPLLDFLLKKDRNETMIFGFDD